MDQTLQNLMPIMVASRMPQEGDFRRNAILGAMVGHANPMAGALVAMRSADAVTALVRERDNLKAAQAAPGKPAEEPGKPPSGGEGGKPVDIGEAARLARQLVQTALRALEALTKFVEEAKKADAGAPSPSEAARAGSGTGPAGTDAGGDGWEGTASAASTGSQPAFETSSLQEEMVAAFGKIAEAAEKMATEAEKAVRNQNENQTSMQQMMQRLGTAQGGGSETSSTVTSGGAPGAGKGGK